MPVRRAMVAVLAPAVVLAGLALPVVSLPGAAASGAPADQPPVSGSLVEVPLSGVDPRGLSASARAAGDGVLRARSTSASGPLLRPVIATGALDTKDFGIVGVVADAPLDEDSRVLIRVREHDTWSEWTQLPVHTEHGPDADSSEAVGIRYGTDPLLTDGADGVQVRIDTPGGEPIDNPAVLLMDSPETEQDADLPLPGDPARGAPAATANAATLGAPMPAIITRAQWGADEAWRSRAASYSGTIKAGFVHHTASTNAYAPEQAAKQVRNLYHWFTKGLRYSDMAYNFLIDRYGRLYEGRAGGLDQPVVGGHTAGFNDSTFAVSALGDFRTFRPDDASLAAMNESLAQLLAWKLSLHHRDPNGTTTLISDSGAGTSRYPAGTAATALVVGGHGDLGKTTCPGRVLTEQLPGIRAMAASKMGVTMINPAVARTVPWGAAEPVQVGATTTAPLAWTMTVLSQCGETVRTLTGQQSAGGALAIAWDKRDDAGNPVPPGTYTLQLIGANGADAVYPWRGTARISPTVDSPPDPCGPPDSFAVAGAGYGHGVGMSQWGAYGMAKAGYDATSIVSHYYSGTTVSPVQDDMDARINLLYRVSSSRMRTEAMDPAGGPVEVTVGATVVVGGPADEFRFAVDGADVRVQRVSGGQVSDVGSGPTATVRWAGTRTPGAAAGGPTLLNVVGPKSSLDSAGHRYRFGYVEVVPVSTTSGNRLNVVNVLRVHDEYLYGISEVSSSWPAAAQQAQVLAARTYALSKVSRGVRVACSCHMDDGGGPYYDQTFTGWIKASSERGNRWVENVNATFASDSTGLAILSNGKPISAFYHSSSGGATQSSQDVWGGTLSYAQSVPDPWMAHEDNPNREWTVDVSQASMARAFGVGAVMRVEVTQRHVSGAARTITATVPDGSQRTLSGGRFQQALGLKSTFVTAIGGSTGAPLPAPAPAPAPAPETPTSTVKPRTVSLLTPTAITVPGGGRYKVVGVVRPAKAGLNAWRQKLVDGVWKTTQKTTTNAKGRYRFVVKKAGRTGGTFRVLVVRKGTVVGVSPDYTVTTQ